MSFLPAEIVPDGGQIAILTQSDVWAGVVSIIQNYVGGVNYGGSGGLAMPAVMAVGISAASRALTQYAVGFGGSSSMFPMMSTGGLTPTTSNLLFVGIFNAVIAYLMKRNVPKQTLIGMEIDSLGYSVMQNAPFVSGQDTVIFGYKSST